MRVSPFCRALGFLICGLVFAARADGAESAAVRSQHVAASLVAEPSAVAPGKPFTVALRLRMDKGWHVYWLNPGDSGLAPKIDWKLPSGFSAGPIEWAVPGTISQPPLMSYGYEGEVWLLTEIVPPADAGGTLSLQALVTWLECADVCIPGSADLKLSLPVRPGAPALDPRFAAARAALPQPYAGEATIAADGDHYQIEVPDGLDFPPAARPRFFPLPSDLIENAAPQVAMRSGGQGSWRVKRDPNAPALPEMVRGVIAATAGEARLGWEIDFRRVEAPAAAPVRPPLSPLIFLFAFLGGLILNLMPCVLPVLALKVLSLARHGSGSRRAGLVQGLWFTAGVLVSFWLLAGLLLLLRAAGEHLGWGFQLQSPGFVILSAALFVVIALNLFGVFEIGGSLIGIGGAAAAAAERRGAALASFGGGALAVVVATPCTAPFMGSALGVALGQPPLAALLVFTALGLGMAFPYLVLAANPAWLRFVPKPGGWMESFKQALGFPMLATVVWLAWVYGRQAGLDAAVLLLLSLLLVALAAWIYGRWTTPVRSPAVRTAATVIAFLLAGATLSFLLTRKPAPPVAADAASAWEKFSPARVAELRAAGKPVFVDFTAAWCLSCQVNQRTSLDVPEVAAAFRRLGVARLKADWTSSDPVVTAALAEFGRQSVPLYVLYAPGKPPRLLPELLTPGIVLRALEELAPPGK